MPKPTIPQQLEAQLAAAVTAQGHGEQTAGGGISLADYMATCLYAPETGYYMTRDPFGPGGDFTTAPEISPLFGDVLGCWVADQWEAMGRPAPFTLLEAGPGRGTLMADMLRALAQVAPDCRAAAQVVLLEVSPVLQNVQEQTLAGAGVQWVSKLADVTFSHPTILIANELLDAFPVRQFEHTPNGWRERLVTQMADGCFGLMLAPAPAQDIAEKTLHELAGNHTSGAVVEVSPAMDAWLADVREMMREGVALFIDYGAAGTGETLQAVRAHNYEGIFDHPGEADLTAHVNFARVAEVLGQAACAPVEDMALFLIRLGLPVRAARLMDAAAAEERDAIATAAARLIDPNQMGGLFKVLVWRAG